jgi:hypothetical protein
MGKAGYPGRPQPRSPLSNLLGRLKLCATPLDQTQMVTCVVEADTTDKAGRTETPILRESKIPKAMALRQEAEAGSLWRKYDRVSECAITMVPLLSKVVQFAIQFIPTGDYL